MKKQITSFLASTFALSILAGCGSQPNAISTFPQAQQRMQPAQLRTFSAQGLKLASQRLKELTFKAMDQNRDNALQHHEFWPGTEHFVKIDRNRDGVLSLEETQKTNHFGNALRLNPKHLRESAKYSWDYVNSNKDKYVTKEEMLATLTPPPMPVPPPYPEPITSPTPTPGSDCGYACTPGYPDQPSYPNEYEQHQLKVQLMTMFNLSDTDRDGKLNFSEFEDMFATQLVSNQETPYPNPAPIYPTSTPTGYPYR